MKCCYCGYEWKPRREKPVSCPRCKRYFFEGLPHSQIEDIKQMLLLISAFVEPGTNGYESLLEWNEKYLGKGDAQNSPPKKEVKSHV